jgi:hypothetical protein
VTPQWDTARTVYLWRNSAPRGQLFNRRDRRPPRSYPLSVTPPSDAATALVFDVAVERLLPDEDSRWELVQEATVAADVEFAGTIDAMEPSQFEGLDEAMRTTFSNGVVKWASGMSPLRVWFDAQHTNSIGAEDLAIGASVEVLFQGTLARRLDIWWPVPLARGNRDIGWVVAYEDEQLVTQAAEADGWEMRVSGNPTVALRAGEASTYWAGEFTVPLTISERGPVAPSKYWWRLEQFEPR